MAPSTLYMNSKICSGRVSSAYAKRMADCVGTLFVSELGMVEQLNAGKFGYGGPLASSLCTSVSLRLAAAPRERISAVLGFNLGAVKTVRVAEGQCVA
jgi:hypothetical protein